LTTLSNAVAAAFFATLKKELTRRRAWPTRRELQSAVFAWIEGWYKPPPPVLHARLPLAHRL